MRDVIIENMFLVNSYLRKVSDDGWIACAKGISIHHVFKDTICLKHCQIDVVDKEGTDRLKGKIDYISKHDLKCECFSCWLCFYVDLVSRSKFQDLHR
jgi:hypothetical protein